jgi:hypothetical protein
VGDRVLGHALAREDKREKKKGARRRWGVLYRRRGGGGVGDGPRRSGGVAWPIAELISIETFSIETSSDLELNSIENSEKSLA